MSSRDESSASVHCSGTLYVVATPIGNLDDMVPRAVEVLQSVSVIAAEDTRHSRHLMTHFGIGTPLISYHEHSDDRDVLRLLQKLQQGESVALISDAGTPLISDPGYQLVDAAITAGVKVVPVPGCSALIAALSASGLPSDRFVFEGFLPAKQAARLTRLRALAIESRTMIFYESPRRLLDCLQDMADSFGDSRVVVLARELTKSFETIHRAALLELIDWVKADSNQQRGECVLLVKGAEVNAELDAAAIHVIQVLNAELPPKQAAALAAKITGLNRKVVYDYWLEQKRS